MLMDTFLTLITEPFMEMYQRLRAFLPNLFAMATILILGSAFCILVRVTLRKLLLALKFDSWCDRMGLTVLMRKGNVWRTPSETLSAITFWIFMVGILLLGLSMLKFETIDLLIANAVHYIPRALSAVLILFLGYLLTGLLSRAVLIAAVNSGYRYSRLLSEAVRLLLTVFFLAMSLEQLQVAPTVVTAAFSIIFGGIVLALAISFGVGGIEAAKRVVEQEADKKDAERPTAEHL